LNITKCDEQWASGDDMVADLKQRLPKALADAGFNGLDVKLHRLVKFLEVVASDFNANEWKTPGATAVYKFWRE
jgi:hypothetical protein